MEINLKMKKKSEDEKNELFIYQTYKVHIRLGKTSIFSDYEYAKIFEKFPVILKLQGHEQRYTKIVIFGHFISNRRVYKHICL